MKHNQKTEKASRPEVPKELLPSSKESDDRYRILVNNIRDYAIFLLDPSGVVMTWNAGGEVLKGYKPEEIIGKHFSVFYTEDDIARKHPQNELKIADRKGRYEEEGWRVRRDGSQFWAHVVITKLNDESGKHIGYAKITRDLTEKKIAEEALRESEERFRLIVESVKDYAIIMLDPDGKVVSWNEGAKRLKGYDAKEVLGKHFGIFYDPEDAVIGKCEFELEEAAATGRFEDEGWRVRKDGTKFWANVVVTALRDRSGVLKGFAKVTRDMTERRRAETKLRLAYENLETRVADRTKELQKAIEARDEFLSIASHELRTPLTALKLQNQILERRLNKNKQDGLSLQETREMINMSSRQVTQLSRLIDDMLDVTRIASGRLRLEINECNLSELLVRIFESFAPQFQAAGVRAELDVEENLKVNCDEQRIEQVIANLLSNAIKYASGSPVEVYLRRVGRIAEVRVKDSGPGISKKDQERIFQRFERATPANEASGLGLGLFISKQIIESHGGHISLESEPGKGATFKFTLPL